MKSILIGSLLFIGQFAFAGNVTLSSLEYQCNLGVLTNNNGVLLTRFSQGKVYAENEAQAVLKAWEMFQADKKNEMLQDYIEMNMNNSLDVICSK